MTHRQPNLAAKKLIATSIACGFLMNAPTVFADERESLEQLKATTTNLIELLVQEGVGVRTRRRQGGAEIPTRRASSTFVIRPSACNSARIIRSISSSFDPGIGGLSFCDWQSVGKSTGLRNNVSQQRNFLRWAQARHDALAAVF